MMFLFTSVISGQDTLDYRYVDSMTYKYYSSGEWSKLIKLGEEALQNNIDFKFLRQRLGYAYFNQSNYYESKLHFGKALTFDSFDQFSLEYMFYSYLNTGGEEYSGVYERRLSPELKKSLNLSSLKPIESIEFEYNYKYAGTDFRSNPQYYRIGVSSKLGYVLSLYQSYSEYNQLITTIQNGRKFSFSDRQQEYYALLKWNAPGNLLFKGAYHFINTSSGNSLTNGNLFLLSISPSFDRFSFELNGSALSLDKELIYQVGTRAGYVFPGRSNFTLTSLFSEVFNPDNYQFIYSQKAGFLLFKKGWIEGNVTLGSLLNYNDYSGLYLYNTYDPIIFKTGSTFIYYLNKNITLWANFSYEQKEFLENSSQHYNQFSYLGGIKWKL
jgi:hypothetical protein